MLSKAELEALAEKYEAQGFESIPELPGDRDHQI